MRIDELDEHQGLEAQMVRDWLTSKGCYRQDGPWRHPTEKYSYTDGEYGGLLWEDTLFKLSVDFELASVQALLREINPRMRAGIPSQEARDAHQGAWVGHSGGNRRNITIGLWDGPEFVRGPVRAGHPNAWSYWPVDHSGNKVRWPEKDGVML